MKSIGKKNFVLPLPVLILGTFDENGKPNAMNAAWGGIEDFDLVRVSLSEHKTTENFSKTGAFTLAMGDLKNVAACDYVGIVSANSVPDKVAKCGWTYAKGEHVNAPVFNELPITLECEVVSFVDGTLIGRVVNTVVREDIFGEDGLPDYSKFTPISYDPIHHNYFAQGEAVAKAFSIGKTIK